MKKLMVIIMSLCTVVALQGMMRSGEEIDALAKNVKTMTDKQLMTADEIHDFGVEVVFDQLKKEGYEMQSVNTKVGINPQIVAKKGKELS